MTSCVGEVGAGGEPVEADTAPSIPRGAAPGVPEAPPPGPPSAPMAGPIVGVPPPATSCTFTPGPAPLRRLTRREYSNTVRDLLGDTSDPARNFGADGFAGPFESNVEVPVSVGVATDYATAAEAIAGRANLDKLLPCKPANTAAEPACARQFLTAFLERAFRRPARDIEITRYLKVHDAARERGHDFAGAVRLLISAALQSPNFLGHIEAGEATLAPGGRGLALTPYELAARVAYFLWKAPPDAALLEAAKVGRLATAADLEREAQRLLADPRAKETTLDFYRQWLQLARLSHLTRDPKVFPAFRPGIGAALARETEAFVSSVLGEGDARLATLLTARFSFVNQTIASVYKLPGITGDNLRRVELDPAERAGILSQPAFLAGEAHFDQTSPVHRGKFVRGNLFCQSTPPPPADVNVTIPVPDPKQTTRQRYLGMLQNPACGGCHRLMNPIGLSMEKYDGMGQFRATENGLPIDASGEIVATADSDGTYDGLIELSARLSRSAEVRECVARTWFTYAVGRHLPPEESCGLRPLYGEFHASGGDLRKVMTGVVKSEAFRMRAVRSTEACQ